MNSNEPPEDPEHSRPRYIVSQISFVELYRICKITLKRQL